MIEPFILRAVVAALILAVVAAPLGCVVVWQRMAYFGETVAQASLIGVALGLSFNVNLTLAVALVAVAVAGVIILLGRQKTTPIDSILGLLHHGALALGVIATALLKGPSVDLVGYLFGDVFAVTPSDLWWVAGGGALVLAALAWLWPSLIRMGVHAELAEAEGVPTERARVLFTLLLALTIAVAMKIVGILLVIAFLIVPAVAARPLSATPERMAILTALVAAVSVVAGIGASATWDTPGGPSIVLVMAVLAGLSLAFAAWRREA